jgi:hypothetical protein
MYRRILSLPVRKARTSDSYVLSDQINGKSSIVNE